MGPPAIVKKETAYVFEYVCREHEAIIVVVVHVCSTFSNIFGKTVNYIKLLYNIFGIQAILSDDLILNVIFNRPS